MAILNEQEARGILEKIMKLSKADECEANLGGSIRGNIRYARNSVSTSGSVSNTQLAVQSSYGNRRGTATINEFDPESLEKVVRRAEELARLAPENPEYMGLLGPQEYAESRAFYESTANITPAYRARAAADSIGPSRKQGLTAAGFLTDSARFQAMMNSRDLFAYHRSSDVNFTVTIRSADGTGSGWVTRNYGDVEKLDTANASKVAIDKALLSREPRELEPGQYTVILEPAASVGLLRNMLNAFDARNADEGRSFLSKTGGGNKLGEKLFDERVNIMMDPTHPDAASSPWANDGQRQPRLHFVRKGVVENLMYSRFWADKQDKKPIPDPNNIIMAGGDDSLEDLIAGTERGVLVTRTWYIRTVDPQTLLYTGLTRDGTFYIENGEIRYPVKNFRFNESPIAILSNLDALGVPERIGARGFSLMGAGQTVPLLIPPMRVKNFTFSSLSDAV